MAERNRKNLKEDVQVPNWVNADYVHSLEESNRTLRRLLNQERRANEELQAVMNELLEELQTVTQAAERSTAIVNRAQRLIQQFPQPPGPAPPVSPRTQRDESPRVGPTPAPSGRASTSSRHSEHRGVKRKSADDLGETEPVKRKRWFTPSAMTIPEDRARCSPPQRNGNSSMGSTPPVASGSADIIKQLNDLMSVVIVEGAQEAEGPTQDRPPEGLETPSTSSTAAASAVSLRSQQSNAAVQGSPCPSLHSSRRSSARSQASTDAAVQGSPCPSLASSRRSSARSHASTDAAIQGSPCPSLASSRSSRASLARAIRGSPCPSLASSADEEDSPQRNPRYNPYYWLRPITRKNYRMSLKGPWR